MFTTLDFWIGVLWGASVMGLFLWYWMIRPMGRLLGFERDDSSPASEPSAKTTASATKQPGSSEDAVSEASSPASSPDLAKIAEGFVGPQSRKESVPAGEPMGTEAAGLNAAAAGADALAEAERAAQSPASDPRECSCRFGPRLAYQWGDHHQEDCPMRSAPAGQAP